MPEGRGNEGARCQNSMGGQRAPRRHFKISNAILNVTRNSMRQNDLNFSRAWLWLVKVRSTEQNWTSYRRSCLLQAKILCTAVFVGKLSMRLPSSSRVRGYASVMS